MFCLFCFISEQFFLIDLCTIQKNTILLLFKTVDRYIFKLIISSSCRRKQAGDDDDET